MKKYIIISIALSLVLMLFLLFSLPLAMLKRKTNNLNNPIVNTHYENWQDISLDEKISIKLPPEWSIQQGEPLLIIDEKGKTIGEGVKTTSFTTDTMQPILSSHYDRNLISFSVYDKKREMPRLFWNQSYSIFRTSLYEDGFESREILFKLCYNDTYKYSFCIYCDEEQAQEFYDIAEAIAWSMTDADSHMIWIAKKALNLI